MRYIIIGAGAIGGLIAARLQQAGREVAVVARGETATTIEQHGLRVVTPAQSSLHQLKVYRHPSEVGFRAGDVIVLAMKTQDTGGALQDLAPWAPPETHIFCAQNGLENERIAHRVFPHVYGMFVFVFSASLAPGEVRCYTAPSFGVLDLGAHPKGSSPTCEAFAADLRAGGFDSQVRSDIMDWKAGKLLANLGNAVNACYGATTSAADILEAAQAEGRACLKAAGIGFATLEQMLERRKHLLPLQQVEGKPFPGSSAWQSLARGAGVTEVDYLTGEIVLLGRLHGVPTPLNAALQLQVRRLAIDKQAPGSLDPALLRRQFGLGSPAPAP